MRISVLVICCFILTLSYEPATGGLVKDFFGNVQNTAQKVRGDIRKALHLNKGEDEVNKETEENEDGTNEVPSKTVETTNNTENVTESKTTTIVPTTLSTTTTQEAVIVTTTTDASLTNGTNISEKEERENFKANCLAGYQRTADGRCKPLF